MLFPPEQIAAICAKSASESFGEFFEDKRYDDIDFVELTDATHNIATGACAAGFAVSLAMHNQEFTVEARDRFFAYFVKKLREWRTDWRINQAYGIVVADPPYESWEELLK